MTDIRAALDAMREDARRWREAAAALNAPLTTVSELTLTSDDVSIAGAMSGLHDTYNAARGEAETMLRTAAAVFDAMGDALSASADAYEFQDRAGAEAFDRLRR